MKRVPYIISIILLLCFVANAQTAVDPGIVQDGTYINSGFNFSFKYPKDWVVHGEATNERIKEIGKERISESGAVSKSSVEVSLKNTHYLLTVFRHPVGTPGITFNPGIIVFAEKVTHAPGITNGKDYLLNVRALLQKTGHQMLLKEPMAYQFGGSEFFRDNFAAEVNGVRISQAFFARVVNGYALVFLFMGEDEKTVDEMAKAMDTYAPVPPIRRGVTIIGTPQEKPKPH